MGRNVFFVILVILTTFVLLVKSGLVGSHFFGKNDVTPTPTLIPTPTPLPIDTSSNLEERLLQLNPADFSEDFIKLRQEAGSF